jgi:hypothetical protein
MSTINQLFNHLEEHQIRLDPLLYKRLATFTPSKWLSKPAQLSPVECALHGWICIEKDVLVCEKCSSRFICHLTLEEDPSKWVAFLTTLHKDHCSNRFLHAATRKYTFSLNSRKFISVSCFRLSIYAEMSFGTLSVALDAGKRVREAFACISL